MPRAITSFEPTPNPNALKCHLSPPLPPLPPDARSYRSADAAATNPLAKALFEIAGVTSVLLMEDWLTVNKTAEADWAGIKRGLKRALSESA